ncbi:MAG: VWA domain-containing protein [Proteobacteria bacterium]|nr:VWA domain-containing protein [Pseudomonadota bacterium]
MLSIENPHALWLILVLPLVWWLAANTKTALGPRHLRLVSVMRGLAVVAVIMGLAQPILRYASQDVSVIYAVDVSRSVAADSIEKALNWIDAVEERHDPARSKLVIFGKNRAVVSSTQEARAITIADLGSDVPLDESGYIEQSGTNLQDAIDESLALLGSDSIKRVVLFSDGNQTTGSLLDLVQAAQRSDVRIFPMVAESAQVEDAWISNVKFPDRLRELEPTTALISVYSPEQTNIEISISSDGDPIATQAYPVDRGFNDVQMNIKFPNSGLIPLDISMNVDDDPYLANNRSRMSAWVEKKARVLYLEGILGASSYLSEALSEGGFEVIVQDRIPKYDELKSYDALILSDVLAEGISSNSMEDIKRYVKDYGGGLIFAGGENTFGDGGYSNSTIEDLLPANFQAQEKRKGMALVIAIDRSYSMKGSKIEYAKEAARASLDLLEEQHYFGVVAFDSQPYVPVPVELVKSKRKAEALISRIQASGQTNIYPALGIVYRLLKDLEVSKKHVILLSDGDTAPAEYERLIERMRDSNIVISTVTIGDGGNPGLMRQLSDWGGGRNYLALSAESIPQIFTEETKKVVGTSLVEEPILTVMKQEIGSLSGIDLQTAPPLKGHIAVKPKDTAETILVTQQGAPLLTRWQYGLGKTMFFTSDVKNRWSADWIQWEGYGKFWSQLTRGVLKQLGSTTVFFNGERQDDVAIFNLTLLTEGGNFRNGLVPELNLSVGQEVRVAKMSQIAPGQYQLVVPFKDQQPISATLLAKSDISDDIVDMAGSRSIFPSFPAEYRFTGPNLELLSAVASSTGGALDARADQVFAPSDDIAQKRFALWPILMILALFAYLVDIFVRRSPLVWERLSD